MTVYPCKTAPVNFGNTYLLQAFVSSGFLFLLVLDTLIKGEREKLEFITVFMPVCQIKTIVG